MACYNCTSNGPRSESYVEDLEVCFSLCLSAVCLSVCVCLSFCLCVCLYVELKWGELHYVPRTDPGLNLMWRILRYVCLSVYLSF
jgi:hypothetical protein